MEYNSNYLDSRVLLFPISSMEWHIPFLIFTSTEEFFEAHHFVSGSESNSIQSHSIQSNNKWKNLTEMDIKKKNNYEWVEKTVTNSFTKSEFRHLIVCLSNECNSGGLCEYSSAHFMNELNHQSPVTIFVAVIESDSFITNDSEQRIEKWAENARRNQQRHA